MHRIKEILVSLLLLLLAMPMENFAQSSGGQISRKPKTAARKETPKKKSTQMSSSGVRQKSSASSALRKRVSFTNYGSYITCSIGNVSFTMKHVTGGTFTMGATSEQGSEAYGNEKPVHQVTLSDYYIGETEVTQELWQTVMGSNPSRFTGNLQRPVEQVSWNDCQVFIKKLNQLMGKTFRLPTEAEWEYAARGGSQSRGYKYSGSNTIGDVAWYKVNSSSTTHLVKQKKPNELGIYDMSGNISEWCQDWYSNKYFSSTPQTNPAGPSDGDLRVDRGGSWSSIAGYCRVSYRDFGSPKGYSYSLGLRLAL